MLDAVEETERKMMEMSALNHLISTHVQQQAQQIEQLYLQVCDPTTEILVILSFELGCLLSATATTQEFVVLHFLKIELLNHIPKQQPLFGRFYLLQYFANVTPVPQLLSVKFYNLRAY